MSVKDIESAVAQLPRPELAEFTAWFEDFLEQEWDKQIEQDVKSGRLDNLLQQVEQEYKSGQCQPL